MKKINVLINSSVRWSSYKSDSEYQAWIDNAVAQNLWGLPGTYTVEVLDATVELEEKRLQSESTKKVDFDSHANNTSNPHAVTKQQIGLDLVDNESASSLRNRTTHTGTQPSSTISDFIEAAQDAVGNSLLNSADINFLYPDQNNRISAELTDSGVVSGTYSLVTVDSKGRVTSGSNVGSVARYSYFTSSTVTNSNATFTTIPNLTTDSLPSGLYRIYFFGRLQSGSTTNGTGLRIVESSAVVSTVSVNWSIGQGASGLQQKFEYPQIAQNVNITSASSAAANTVFNSEGTGVIRISSAGSVTIQIRSELNGTASSILPNSFLILELV